MTLPLCFGKGTLNDCAKSTPVLSCVGGQAKGRQAHSLKGHARLMVCHQQPTERQQMDLKTYFLEEPRGARKEMADYLEITPTWMSLLIHKKVKPSPELAIRIEKATQKLVSRKELLPDIFVR